MTSSGTSLGCTTPRAVRLDELEALLAEEQGADALADLFLVGARTFAPRSGRSEL